MPTGFEVLAERSVRIAEENERLKVQNLQYSNEILTMQKTILRFREERVTHLLREQDFYDLQQKIVLSKEMGCAYKKANRLCKKFKFWHRVVTSAIEFNEADVVGFNEAVRQRKIRRKKLCRSITIAEFPRDLWTPPVPRTAIQVSSEGDDETNQNDVEEASTRRPTTTPKKKGKGAANRPNGPSPTKRVTGRQNLTGSVANHSQRDVVNTAAARPNETLSTPAALPDQNATDPENPTLALEQTATGSNTQNTHENDPTLENGNQQESNIDPANPDDTITEDDLPAGSNQFPDMPMSCLTNDGSDPNWILPDSQDSTSTSASKDLVIGASKKRTRRVPIDSYVPMTRSAKKRRGKLTVLCHGILSIFLCHTCYSTILLLL